MPSSATPRHVGAAHGIVPELVIREVLLEGFHLVAGDESRIREIVERLDDVLQGGPERWEDEMRRAIRELPGRVRCAVGYPDSKASAPWVSIVKDSSHEDPGSRLSGDVIRRRWIKRGDDRAERVTIIGADEETVVQVGSWSPVPEEGLLMNEVVRNILFRDKGRLFTAGVQDISFSESGDQPHPELFPWVAYVPMIRATLSWTRRQTLPGDICPSAITITTTFSN